MTRSELQHALACEDVSEGLRTIIDDLWTRLERLETLAETHHHAHTGHPVVSVGDWPNRHNVAVSAR